MVSFPSNFTLVNQCHLSTDLKLGNKATLLVSAIVIGLLIVSDDYDEIDDCLSDNHSINDGRPVVNDYEDDLYFALDPDGYLCAPGA